MIKKGLGLNLPLTTDNKTFFALNYTTDSLIKDNIRNLLFTNKGERIMNPNFGCDLLKMIFETSDDVLISNITDEIERCFLDNMPYISVNNIIVNSNEHSINLRIEYSTNNNIEDYIEFILS